jgi:hypothetical protein
MMYNFWMNVTDYNDLSSIYTPAAYFSSQIPPLNLEGGFQGYFYAWPHGLLGNFQAPNKFADSAKMIAIIDPILEKMSKMPGIDTKSLIKAPPSANPFGALAGLMGNASAPKPLNPRAEMNHFNKRHGPNGDVMTANGLFDMDSHLLGEAELTNPKLADALRKAHLQVLDGHLRLHVTGGGKVLQENNATSVLPAWRKAFVHILGAGQGTGNVDSMRELAPNMGAYVNEVILLTLIENLG